MRVGLFVTCLVDLMRRKSALRPSSCSKAPDTRSSCPPPRPAAVSRATTRATAAALALAERSSREFEDCDYVVAPSGSCAGMIRTHYPDLFRAPPELERAQRVCSKTYQLTDFLVNVLHVETCPAGSRDR